MHMNEKKLIEVNVLGRFLFWSKSFYFLSKESQTYISFNQKLESCQVKAKLAKTVDLVSNAEVSKLK